MLKFFKKKAPIKRYEELEPRITYESCGYAGEPKSKIIRRFLFKESVYTDDLFKIVTKITIGSHPIVQKISTGIDLSRLSDANYKPFLQNNYFLGIPFQKMDNLRNVIEIETSH